MTNNFDPVYRDYSCSLSAKNCAKLLQAVGVSGANITSSFTLSNGFPESKVQYFEMFFRLKFLNQDRLDTFHSFGLETSEPEIVEAPASLYSGDDDE